MINVYVTHPNQEHAQRIEKALLEANLIACSNSWEINSSYRWEGKVVNELEIATLFKTDRSKWDELRDRIVRLHDYDVPCIEMWNTDASPSYLAWVSSETQAS